MSALIYYFTSEITMLPWHPSLKMVQTLSPMILIATVIKWSACEIRETGGKQAYFSHGQGFGYRPSRVSFDIPRSVRKRKRLRASSTFRLEHALKIQTYSGVSHA